MTAREKTQARLLERHLLHQAAETLYAVWMQRDPRPFLHSTDLGRLKHGTAGFLLVVKAARALGLEVRLELGVAADAVVG